MAGYQASASLTKTAIIWFLTGFVYAMFAVVLALGVYTFRELPRGQCRRDRMARFSEAPGPMADDGREPVDPDWPWLRDCRTGWGATSPRGPWAVDELSCFSEHRRPPRLNHPPAYLPE